MTKLRTAPMLGFVPEEVRCRECAIIRGHVCTIWAGLSHKYTNALTHEQVTQEMVEGHPHMMSTIKGGERSPKIRHSVGGCVDCKVLVSC